MRAQTKRPQAILAFLTDQVVRNSDLDSEDEQIIQEQLGVIVERHRSAVTPDSTTENVDDPLERLKKMH